MSVRGNSTAGATPNRERLTETEARAVAEARECGWLTLTAAIGEDALGLWQSDCERNARPFAVVRPERNRASLWFVLADGAEWSAEQERHAREALREAHGFILSENSARAFAKSGSAAELMRELIALSRHPLH
jgi:hypothetical protein